MANGSTNTTTFLHSASRFSTPHPHWSCRDLPVFLLTESLRPLGQTNPLTPHTFFDGSDIGTAWSVGSPDNRLQHWECTPREAISRGVICLQSMKSDTAHSI